MCTFWFHNHGAGISILLTVFQGDAISLLIINLVLHSKLFILFIFIHIFTHISRNCLRVLAGQTFGGGEPRLTRVVSPARARTVYSCTAYAQRSRLLAEVAATAARRAYSGATMLQGRFVTPHSGIHRAVSFHLLCYSTRKIETKMNQTLPTSSCINILQSVRYLAARGAIKQVNRSPFKLSVAPMGFTAGHPGNGRRAVFVFYCAVSSEMLHRLLLQLVQLYSTEQDRKHECLSLCLQLGLREIRFLNFSGLRNSYH